MVESILITGASGLLGSNLALDFSQQFEVWGVFKDHQLALPSVRMIGADLAEARTASMVIGKVKPDLVVHCAAATDIDRCQREPDWAMRLNRNMAAAVAKAAADYGAGLIHISTDAVFSSDQVPHREDDSPAPPNRYAESKLAGENAVLESHQSALVIRTNLFGWNHQPGKLSLAEWFLSNLDAGREVNGFADVMFSPILVNDLGGLLLNLWREGAAGVLHVAGADCISKFAFGRRLAAAFGFDPELVIRSRLDQSDLNAPRTKMLCLDCSKAEKILGRGMPRLETMLHRFSRLNSAAIHSGSLA
jgi:dTDP-4-dehydrorhamnose reductase